MLDILFPVFSLPAATAIWLLCALSLAVGVWRFYGSALLVHYGASLLLWSAFVIAWADTSGPGAWATLDGVLARTAPANLLGTVALLVLMRCGPLDYLALWEPGALSWRRLMRLTLPVLVPVLGLQVALVHGFTATVLAAGWWISLGLWFGMALASSVTFLALLRWPRWREAWEDRVYMVARQRLDGPEA